MDMKKLKAMQLRVGEHRKIVEELSLVLDGKVEEERRHIQADILRQLRNEIEREIDHARYIETAAQCGGNKAKLVIGLGSLALGSLLTATSKNALTRSISTHLVNSAFGDKAPYGNVMVAIRGGEIPGDIRVVSVSRIARESRISESKEVL